VSTELDRGNGRPARGYSWPPFEPRNTAAVKSGFWASPLLREDDRVEVAEIEASLRELMPAYASAFEPMVEQVACRIWRQRRGYADLSENGLVRDGQPAPLLVDLAKLERQIARDLVELGMTPRSAAALGVDVAAAQKVLGLTRIDADAVAALTRDLQEVGLHCVDPTRPVRPLGRSSVENYLKPAQGVLALAARRGWIESSPFSVLLPDDRPRDDAERPPEHEWKPEDIAALIDAASRVAARPESRYDYAPLVTVSATLGPRLGECLGWLWEDFDKDADDGAGVLHIRRQWLRTGEYAPTKTPAAVRTLPLPSELRDLLIALRLRSRYSSDADPIFASHSGKPLGHWNVPARGFAPARDLAGLPSSVTFHCLRDAAASRLINAGLDPVAVATFLGHEDATTTLRKYARLFDRRRTGDAVRAALQGAVEQSTF